jgi:hypothetical protein
MLRRVNAGLFEEDDGAAIELAVQAQNNGGTEAAQFDYDSNVLSQDTVQGFPGCRFTVQPGIRQFRALVVFAPAAPSTARYDLFQVNAAGTLTSVGKSVTNTGSTPLIGFGIDGVAVPALAGAAAGRRRMPTPPRRARRKTTMARRKASTSAKPKRASRKVKSAAPKSKTAARKRKAPRRSARKSRKRTSTKKR